MLDFPASPTVGQKFPVPPTAGMPVYTWDGEKWTTGSSDYNYPRESNIISATTYTFVLADAGKIVWFTNAAAVTVTIPPNSAVAFPVGTQIDVAQSGAGQVSFTPGSGVTLNSVDTSRKLLKQYAAGTLIKGATDTWLLTGSITP
jgi:hypothetical protein